MQTPRMTTEEIVNRFGYHPGTDETIPVHEKVREAFVAFVTYMNLVVPDGRAKSTGMTNLQQAAMWFNFGIAEMAPVVEPQDISAPTPKVTIVNHDV